MREVFEPDVFADGIGFVVSAASGLGAVAALVVSTGGAERDVAVSALGFCVAHAATSASTMAT